MNLSDIVSAIFYGGMTYQVDKLGVDPKIFKRKMINRIRLWKKRSIQKNKIHLMELKNG